MMAGIDVMHDDDIGRGRRSGNDSSSSRESSPQPRQKRSFSPTSDDGDLVVTPIEDDDTPPPPERPLIRQALGFSWDASTSISATPTSINTYEASLPQEPRHFLPGQEVLHLPPPPKPKRKAPSRSKKAASTSKKTKHFNDQFSTQTSSFRIKSYDPTAPVVPPVHYGSGPYSSLYRAVPPAEMDQTVNTAPTTFGVTSTAGDDSRRRFITNESSSTLPSSSTRAHQENLLASQSAKSKTSRSKAKLSGSNASKTNVSDTLALQKSSQHPPTDHRERTLADSTFSRGDSANGVSYYRRDYEREKSLQASSQLSPSTSTTLGHSPQPESYLRRGSPASSVTASPRQGSSRSNDFQSEVPSYKSNYSREPQPSNSNLDTTVKSIIRPLRMVTLLIEDIRSGESDSQLAEVKVPLRPADDPEDGFWADAKDICDKLQASPSRIDGPAKVYTFRGKYRQFFLRVSSDNVDECISANISISPDRTLDVVVEANPSPGAMPLPPKISRNLNRTPTPEQEVPSFKSAVVPIEAQNCRSDAEITEQVKRNRESKKRRHSLSPSFDGRDNDVNSSSHPQQCSSGTLSSSHHPSPYESSKHTSYSSAIGNVPPKKQRTHATDESPTNSRLKEYLQEETLSRFPSHDTRGYQTPDSGAESDEVDEATTKAMRQAIWNDSCLVEFFKSKGIPGHPRVEEALKQYEFVQRITNEWVGRRAPFRSRICVVRRIHVLNALSLDEKWDSMCTETLNLLKFYGPKGTRCEDSRIIDMINDQTVPGRHAKPAKRFLDLLRKIDQDWINKGHRDPRGATQPTLDTIEAARTEGEGKLFVS